MCFSMALQYGLCARAVCELLHFAVLFHYYVFPAGEILLAVYRVCVKQNVQTFQGGVSTMAECVSVCLCVYGGR